MYNILEHVSSIVDLKNYIDLGIIQLFDKHELEWIFKYCSTDVIDLFLNTYRNNSCLVPIVYNITNGDMILPYNDNEIEYYINMGYTDLKLEDYYTTNIQVIQYMEKIGTIIDYQFVVENTFDEDIDPYIIRKCLELNIDVKFYPTDNNVIELIKHVNPNDVWDKLNMESDILYTSFLDILYINNIPIYPKISNYTGKHLKWVLDHIYYFQASDILMEYIYTGSISLNIIESLDYTNIILLGIIRLDNNVLQNIKRLKNELHEDNVYEFSCKVVLYSNSLLLWVSYLKNVCYNIYHGLNVCDSIIFLHYLPNTKIIINRKCSNVSILKTVRLYGMGYKVLCEKYSTDNTVKYVMELVNSNRRISIKPGFEDLTIITMH